VLARHEGEVAPDAAAQGSEEVLHLARENDISRIVVDIRSMTGATDPSDLRSFMEANAEVTPPRPHAAVLVREDQHPQFRLIEDFAVSRGMPVRVFVDEAAAMNWLAD
jgi:hypothetical protein